MIHTFFHRTFAYMRNGKKECDVLKHAMGENCDVIKTTKSNTISQKKSYKNVIRTQTSKTKKKNNQKLSFHLAST